MHNRPIQWLLMSCGSSHYQIISWHDIGNVILAGSSLPWRQRSTTFAISMSNIDIKINSDNKKIMFVFIQNNLTHKWSNLHFPDSKLHGANMGSTWVLSAPGRPHVGPMNLAIRVIRRLFLAFPSFDPIYQSYLVLREPECLEFFKPYEAVWQTSQLVVTQVEDSQTRDAANLIRQVLQVVTP